MLPNHKKKTAIFLSLAVFFLALDRFLKSLALNQFFNNSVCLINDFFCLTLIKNYYIAFSISWFSGYLLNLLSLLAITGLFYYLVYSYKKNFHINKIFLLSIFILGAVSNFFDRIKLGYVVDYFDLKYFSVFNLADVMIVLGAGGLIWLSLKKT